MKKSKIFIVISIFFFLFLNLQDVGAFLDEDNGLDLYNNINDWVYKLEVKNYEYNITKWWTVSLAERINEVLWSDCIKSNITLSDLDKIVNWDITTLETYINDSCKDDWWDFNYTSDLQNYFNKIISLNNESKNDAVDKTKITYNIARTWMYSDWDDTNSPFDLIKDLENINNVIFSLTKEYKYDWTEKRSLWDFLWADFWVDDNDANSLIDWTTPTTDSSTWDTSSSSGITNNDNSWTTDNSTNSEEVYSSDWYVCTEENSLDLTWLDNTALNKILVALGKTTDTSSSSSSNKNTSSNTSSGGDDTYTLTFEEPNWDVSISDLSSNIFSPVSNCDGFFCIKIEFKKSNHNLLWWWTSTNSSIEWVIQKSNDHLYKYSNTSLEQHQMTVNNWELSIKNLKLSDIFNFNIIVFTRDIPSLNIEKNKTDTQQSKDNSSYSANSLLKQYYSKYWLDYDRANSMDAVYSMEAQLKSINDSTENSITDAADKYNQYLQSTQDDQTNNELLSDIINTKEKYDNMSDLSWVFWDLFSFTNTFEVYVQWLVTQIKKMSEKQTW